MKNLLLVALILHLVITIVESKKYQFGDIIVFPRGCVINGAKPVFNHYAVYVGTASEGHDVGQGDNDIFHFAGKPKSKATCKFSKIENKKGKSDEKQFNFLDGVEGFTPGTQEDITERIKKVLEACPQYNLFKKNCEHLATYVRYGKKLSLQTDSLAEAFSAIKKETKEKLKQVKDDFLNEVRCSY